MAEQSLVGSLLVPSAVVSRAVAAGHSDWVEHLPARVNELSEEWGLTIRRPLQGGTESLVVSAERADGTLAVLKVSPPRHATHPHREVAALRLANSAGCVGLLEVSSDESALLLERLGRALDLAELSTPDRDRKLVEVAKTFWTPIVDPSPFFDGPAMCGLFRNRISELFEQLGHPCEEATVAHALECVARREAAHDAETSVLAHGDLHDANALVFGAGYKLIDPVGVWAEPEFDLGIVMRLDPDSSIESGDDERLEAVAALADADVESIRDWLAIQRVSNGLFSLQAGATDWGRRQLAAADAAAQRRRPPYEPISHDGFVAPPFDEAMARIAAGTVRHDALDSSLRPLVSVMIATYNHEPYIAACVESVLAQKAPFPFEVIVGDDGSSDATPEILLDLQRRYPDRLTVLLATENLGGAGYFNNLRCIHECAGEYTAWVDGDDYWIDDTKLARQVAMLRWNPDAVACGAGGLSLTSQGGLSPRFTYAKGFVELDDLVAENPLPMSSMLYRSSFLRTLDAGGVDWLWHWTAALVAPIPVISGLSIVYRRTGAGMWTGMSFGEQWRTIANHYTDSLLPLVTHSGDSRLSLATNASVSAHSIADLAEAIDRSDMSSANELLQTYCRTENRPTYHDSVVGHLLHHGGFADNCLERFLAEALHRSPQNLPLAHQYASELQRLGRLEDAERVIGAMDAIKVVESYEAATVVALRATLLAETDRVGEAIAELEELVRTGYADLETRRQLGSYYLSSGRSEEGISLLTHVADEIPPGSDLHAVTTGQIARCLWDLNRIDEAIVLLEQFWAAGSSDLECARLLGSGYLQVGRVAESLPIFGYILSTADPQSRMHEVVSEKVDEAMRTLGITTPG